VNSGTENAAATAVVMSTRVVFIGYVLLATGGWKCPFADASTRFSNTDRRPIIPEHPTQSRAFPESGE